MKFTKDESRIPLSLALSKAKVRRVWGKPPSRIVAVDSRSRLVAECQLAGGEGFRKGLPRSVELDMLPSDRDITVSFSQMREAWIRGWDEAQCPSGAEGARRSHTPDSTFRR